MLKYYTRKIIYQINLKSLSINNFQYGKANTKFDIAIVGNGIIGVNFFFKNEISKKNCV